jgi:pimeloyl-ACP methyl ester carboxylesterase
LSPHYQLNLKRQGQGPVLVLIHGVAGSSKLWDPVVPALADRYDVVRVDLLGYGYSDKPNVSYTPALHAQSIRRSLQDHGVRPPYILAGLSMGCLLTLEYARRWPDEVLSLLQIGLPYYPTARQARRYLRRSITARLALEWGWAGRLLISGIWLVGRRSRHLAGLFSTIYSPEMSREAMMVSYQAFYTTLVNCMIENRPDPLLHDTRRIRQAYLHGSADRYTSVEALSDALQGRPGVSVTLMPGVSHNAVVLAPAATAAWMLSSLEAS